MYTSMKSSKENMYTAQTLPGSRAWTSGKTDQMSEVTSASLRHIIGYNYKPRKHKYLQIEWYIYGKRYEDGTIR